MLRFPPRSRPITLSESAGHYRPARGNFHEPVVMFDAFDSRDGSRPHSGARDVRGMCSIRTESSRVAQAIQCSPNADPVESRSGDAIAPISLAFPCTPPVACRPASLPRVVAAAGGRHRVQLCDGSSTDVKCRDKQAGLGLTNRYMQTIERRAAIDPKSARRGCGGSGAPVRR